MSVFIDLRCHVDKYKAIDYFDDEYETCSTAFLFTNKVPRPPIEGVCFVIFDAVKIVI